MKRREESGAVLPVVALMIVVLMLAVGFTVDLGALSARTRRLQGLADIIALDAAKELNGTSCDAQFTTVQAAVLASATRNGHDYSVGSSKTLGFQLGTLARVPSGDDKGKIEYTSAGRATFTAIEPCPGSTTRPDAVRVTVGDHVEYGFSRVVGFSGSDPRRSGIGVQRPIGAFNIGSHVGTFDSSRAGLYNTLLGPMFCATPLAPCNATVTAAGYNGLAATHITLEQLRVAMGAGSIDSLLNSNVTAAEVFTAAANAMSGSSVAETNARTALLAMAASATGTSTFKLRDFIQVQQGGTDDEGNKVTANTGINLLTLIQASAALANGESAVSIPTAAIALPSGVSSLTVAFSLVEGPKTYIGQPGAGEETRQVTMTVTPTFNLPVAAGVFDLGAATITGTMPIVVNSGQATAKLEAASCYTGTFKNITTSTDVNAANTSATGTLTVRSLLNVVLGTMNVSATGATATGTYVDTFDYLGEYYQPVNHGNHQVGLGAMSFSATTFTVGPVTTTATTAMTSPIKNTIATIDSTVVEPITNLLGVSLGSADVEAVEPLLCSAPTIVG